MGGGQCFRVCLKKRSDIQVFYSKKELNQNLRMNNKSEKPTDKDSSIININNIRNININTSLKSIEKEQNIVKNSKENKEEENKDYINQNLNKINEQKNILENKIKNLEKYKDKLENDIKKLEEDIKKLEEDIKNKNNELKNMNDFIQKSKSKFNVENEKLIKIKKELENKANLLKDKENNFEKEKNQFNIKLNELKQKENNLKIKENDLNLREQKIIKKEKELIQRENIIAEIEKKNKIVLIGLNNIGATCYMNATLECLSNTKELTEYFLKTYKKDPNKKMANEYYEVLKNLWNVNSNSVSYSPYSFKEVLSKENPLFAGIAANDSKDLINFLIERLHIELNVAKIEDMNKINNNEFYQSDQTNELSLLKEFLEDYTKKFNSPISNLFYGILETKSQCQGCSVIKYNFQIYSFLEFPLQQVNQYYFQQGKRPLVTNEGKNPDVDLYECFEYNRKVDLMTGDNQMFCNICNKLCNTYYSTTLYSGPNNLIINLNRGKGAVYECKVNFPSQLNILNYITYNAGMAVYELYAVICHLGPSSMSGHFVAYCKNRIDNQWYLYNDAIITKCTRKYQYNDGMPYILFYRAISCD